MSVIRTKKVAKIQTELNQRHEVKKAVEAVKMKKLIRRLTFFGLFALVTAYFMISTIVSQASSLEKRENEKAELQQEIAELKNKEKELREEIVNLNDDEYLAKLARRDYFLSEDGEIIFNIPEEKRKK